MTIAESQQKLLRTEPKAAAPRGCSRRLHRGGGQGGAAVTAGRREPKRSLCTRGRTRPAPQDFVGVATPYRVTPTPIPARDAIAHLHATHVAGSGVFH
jgi:hypothetical protein